MFYEQRICRFKRKLFSPTQLSLSQRVRKLPQKWGENHLSIHEIRIDIDVERCMSGSVGGCGDRAAGDSGGSQIRMVDNTRVPSL